jgi:alpha-1,2-mannosyltransferase
MSDIWQALRSGSWLTPARARNYSLILLTVAGLAIIGWIAMSDGLVDRNGKPIGTDFSSFYAAGTLALEGHAADAYDMVTHAARERRSFGAQTPYYAWLYPPDFFLLAAPLALLPYPLALAVWQGATLALYLWVIAAVLSKARTESRVVAHSWLAVAAAFPAVFINLGHGQNAFLSAALFGAALVSLQRRPVLAGMLFGALTYKPQLVIVLPFALLAAGQWRTIAAAAVTAIVLASASYLIFGADAWSVFIASTETSRKLLLEDGSVGFEKLQSVFAAVRMWGGSVPLAYIVQGAASALAICGTLWLWHSGERRELKAAGLLAATTLASPHVLDYDLVLLAPAIAFFVAARSDTRLQNFEISLLAAIWTAPLLAGTVAAPIGVLASLVLFGLIIQASDGIIAARQRGSRVEMRACGRAAATATDAER